MAKNLKFLDFYFLNRERFQSLLSDLQELEKIASSPIESATALEDFDTKVADFFDVIDNFW